MSNSSTLTEHIRSNINLVAQNVILTPFLPLRVFSGYTELKMDFAGSGQSAGFGAALSVICCGISAQNVFNAIGAFKGTKCKNIMFLGSCGGLGNTKIGDILIADQKNLFGVEGLAGGFKKYLNDNTVPFRSSRVYSVESIKDETDALIDNLVKGGFDGVDLETSVFQRAAVSSGFNACAALYVTDKPLIRPFTAKFTKEERDSIVSARDTLVKTAVRFMENLE